MCSCLLFVLDEHITFNIPMMQNVYSEGQRITAIANDEACNNFYIHLKHNRCQVNVTVVQYYMESSQFSSGNDSHVYKI